MQNRNIVQIISTRYWFISVFIYELSIISITFVLRFIAYMPSPRIMGMRNASISMNRNDLCLLYMLQFEQDARWTAITCFEETIEDNKPIRNKPKHQVHNTNLTTINLKPHVLINLPTMADLKLRQILHQINNLIYPI